MRLLPVLVLLNVNVPILLDDASTSESVPPALTATVPVVPPTGPMLVPPVMFSVPVLTVTAVLPKMG